MDPRIEKRDKILMREQVRRQRLEDLLRHQLKINHEKRMKQLITPSKKVQPHPDLNKRRREKNIRNQQERTKNIGQERIPYHLKF